ncbi:hypothetical protein MUP42_03285, partial [Candidatus Bathyarchaeota archaeon]|nr:hypothetical protein [Candidatus Bathyarchaeota archaeon]
ATGSVSTPSLTALANISITGVQGAGAVGTITSLQGITTNLDSVSATGSIGTITAKAGTTVSLTGVVATGPIDHKYIVDEMLYDECQRCFSNWSNMSWNSTNP